MIRYATLTLLLFLLTPIAPAQIQNIFKRIGIGKSDKPGNDKVVAGLKEALQVGTDNTVKSTGRVDGYFRNELIKILMPQKLRAIEKGLRFMGQGDMVDELVLGMNRAAEKAAPFAKKIFVDAILAMSFGDARKILTGGDTAATEYFKEKTSDELGEAFRPVVEKSMSEVRVSQQYKELMGRADSIPFVKSQAFDLDQYVVDKALGGLFHVLGEEERKIRKNPAARVTSLLREVFGGSELKN